MRVLVLALPIGLLGLVVSMLRRVVITVGLNEHAGAVAIARHTRGWRVVGLVLGVVVAGLLFSLGERVDALGRLTALAPVALGAGILLGTIVGELTARPPVGIRRSAVMERRSLGALVPRGRAVVLGVGSALLAGTLGIGAAWGSPDDLGRAGRSYARTCEVVLPDLGRTTMGSAHGPWPGSFYAVPLAVAFVVLAVLVAVALRAVVARPRPELDSHGLDTTLRRWSVGNVLTAATVTVLGTLGPVSGLVLSALMANTCPGTGVETAVAWVAAVVSPVATGASLGLLAGLFLTPTIKVDDLPRPLPGDATPVGAPVR
ncbi:hypothetical protein [Oryzobacter telluris]|uniref:hypothetical protein n=1 Tax=Oryzobacter telluris TaxID=3149179 RepID=UPI00370D9B13